MAEECIICCGDGAPNHCQSCVGAIFDEGMLCGMAAYEGVMGMARMIAARERAKPHPIPAEWVGCNRRMGVTSIRCNLLNDHQGSCKRIGAKGTVLHYWDKEAGDT